MWSPPSVSKCGARSSRARASRSVHQLQHRLAQQVQQPARPGQLPAGGRAEHRPDQRPGAGLAQGHQLDHRVAGLNARSVQLPQPAPVPRGVGHLDRPAPVEGHRPVPAERDAGRTGPRRRAGEHFEQRLQRRSAQAAAQVPKRPERCRAMAVRYRSQRGQRQCQTGGQGNALRSRTYRGPR